MKLLTNSRHNHYKSMESSRVLKQLVAAGKLAEADALQLKSAFAHDSHMHRTHTIAENVTLQSSLPAYSQMLATSKAFNTAELLELILNMLLAKDLVINVQRTCKAFKYSIDNSASITRKLFRIPDPDSVA
jgi:Na+-transporting NADH:ubiquinone oxidoreductase subunit NqrD